MSFRKYFMNEFPEVMAAYRAAVLSLRQQHEHEGSCRCIHDKSIQCDPSSCTIARPWRKVSPERAVELMALRDTRFQPSNFWLAWYVVTLLNETVHTHFREKYDPWVAEFGADPIPMVACGLAGWQVARPYHLLRYASRDPRRWAEVCSLIVEKAPPHLRSVGIDPITFFEALMADPDFGHGRLETILAEHLRAFCEAKDGATESE